MKRSLAGLALGAALQWTLLAPPAHAEEPRIELMVTPGYLPGVPVLVRFDRTTAPGVPLAREPWNGVVALSSDRAEVELVPDAIELRGGMGSALVAISGGGDFTLRAEIGGQSVERELRDLTGEPIHSVQGTLDGEATEWSGIVHVTADVQVPVGHTLTIRPGTLVVLDGVATGEDGVDLNVKGTLEALGTRDEPVSFTAAATHEPWGEIDFDGATGRLQNALITRAGSSPAGGHTSSGPAVRSREDSTVELDGCVISDIAGKIMTADDSDLVFRDCILARAIMGPEIDDSAALLERCLIAEMRGEDDNDGIYLHSQKAGQELTLQDVIVAGGDDDGIDTLRSTVTIAECVVRDFADKGISAFSSDLTVTQTILADCDIGVSNKSDDPDGSLVRIDRSTIVGNRLGIEANDKFDEPENDVRFKVSSSIVRCDTTLETGFADEKMQISYSALGDDWPGEGNFTDDPEFVDGNAWDFRLSAGSPCIDSGDPAAELDPDGTRADRGALPRSTVVDAPRFTRGSTNGDEWIDISDAISILFHLFGGRSIPCRDAADANDDGGVSLGDAVFLLEAIFTGGPDIPHPSACGTDPTEDDLDCAKEACA